MPFLLVIICPGILLCFEPEMSSYDFFPSTSLSIYTRVQKRLMEIQLLGTFDTVYQPLILKLRIK